MSLLADIFTGEVDAADVFFLIATILAVVAAGLAWSTRADALRHATPVGWLSVACLAFGFLLL